MSDRAIDGGGPAPDAAIVLAGGFGRRLGGADKPALTLAGRTLLSIALAAVAPARTVVVGPPRDLPSGVLSTWEDPPGGGPAAAVVAGLRELRPVGLVAVVAADLPGLTAAVISRLCAALRDSAGAGVVGVDAEHRRQYLLGVWRAAPLTAAAEARQSWAGARLADLLDPLIGGLVPVAEAEAADVDRPADVQRWGIAPGSGRSEPTEPSPSP